MAKQFYTKEYMLSNTVEKPIRNSFIDLEGKQVENITILGWAGIEGKENKWWCVCSCDSERFFKVNSTSLKKNITTSCGCSYKNNGGRKVKSEDFAQEKVKDNWTVLEYNGMNHFAKVKCKDCGKEHHFDSFYSVIQSNPCCYSSDEQRHKICEDQGYTYIQPRQNYKYLLKCKSCGVEVEKKLSDLTPCPCTLGREDEDQWAVYIFHWKNNIHKIGVSVDPLQRLNTFKNNPDVPPLTVKNIQWFYSKQSAYAVESYYHKVLEDRKYNFNTSFDGSTEYFNVGYEEIVKLQDQRFFKKMEVEAPKKDFRFFGICYEGVWYPTRKDLAKDFRISRETLKDRLNYGWTFDDALKTPLKTANKYWWKGEYKTLREIWEEEDPGYSFKKLRDRVQAKQYSIEEALTLKPKIKNYLVDGERLTPKEIANKYGYKYNRFRKMGKNLKDFLINNLDCEVIPL